MLFKPSLLSLIHCYMKIFYYPVEVIDGCLHVMASCYGVIPIQFGWFLRLLSLHALVFLQKTCFYNNMPGESD